MFEPTRNDALAATPYRAGAPRPPQGNKIVYVEHVARVKGKARDGGKGKVSWKRVIIRLVSLVLILGLAVLVVIGGVLWRGRVMREKEAERTKFEWEERKRKGTGAADNGHTKVQLWEDGPYWADTNIGAEKPWESGYYFWWGDTVGYKRQGDTWEGPWVASDGSKLDFPFRKKNMPTYEKGIDELQSEGWITSDNILARKHDAAQAHWGGRWRMPTDRELHDLNMMCDWTWTRINGVNGYVVRGKGAYVSAGIFLPCAGYVDGTSLHNAGSRGYYWSSVPNSDSRNDAWNLSFNSSGHFTSYYYRRYYGHSVRPVQGFTKKRTK